MVRAKIEDTAPETSEEEVVLQPFMVIVDGHDRTIMAKDRADLEAKLAKMRAS